MDFMIVFFRTKLLVPVTACAAAARDVCSAFATLKAAAAAVAPYPAVPTLTL
jgi:hypothetical protein